jgi:hypothetical protein
MAEELKKDPDDKWWLRALLALEVILVFGLMAGLILAGLVQFDMAGWYSFFTAK